jgi:cation:H+ antiporter
MLEGLSPTANGAIFVVSAVVVWFAGARLARLADALVAQTGLGHAVMGVVLLGGVTSLPEIAVAVTATLEGTPLLAVNNVIGSAAINVVILAACDAALRRDALTSVQGSSGVLLTGVVSIVLMALVAAASLVGDRPFAGMGIWAWIILAAYLASVRLIARPHARESWRPVDLDRRSGEQRDAEGPSEDRDDQDGSVRATTVRIVGVGIVIVVAGFLLARSGDALAAATGLGASFFGAVVLGFATSLPEWSTVIESLRIRRYSMAIGDIFGTNLFNVAIIVLVDAVLRGDEPVLAQAGRFAGFSALLGLTLTAVFLVGLLERQNRTLLRMGFDSVLVLVSYAAGVVVLHAIR